MNTYKLILKRRTIRKFAQAKIRESVLVACINAGRVAPSAANSQPLEYILITKNLNSIFECIHWASYLKNGDPEINERPTAYILILSNTEINKEAKYDVGLAAENIVLTALERGIASCIIGYLERDKLIKNLAIPDKYVVELVLALGYPQQKSVKDKFSGDVRYWIDKEGILHVPKRKLEDIIHKEIF